MFYKGMDEAMQGMTAMQTMQDVIANNLANANTPGFQEDNLMVADFDSMYEAAMNGEAVAAGYTPAGGNANSDIHLLTKSITKFEQGQLKVTHQPFDLALDGKGFFTIQSQYGTRFTRGGNFVVNGQGFLASSDGGLVLGDHGPIKVKGNTFKVNEDGSVLVDGKAVDKLRISWVDENKLNKVGAADFRTVNAMAWPAVNRPKVMQGYLEMSNVNAVKLMVSMIAVMRAFEAGQKVLQTEDQMAQKANQTGQVQ